MQSTSQLFNSLIFAFLFPAVILNFININIISVILSIHYDCSITSLKHISCSFSLSINYFIVILWTKSQYNMSLLVHFKINSSYSLEISVHHSRINSFLKFLQLIINLTQLPFPHLSDINTFWFWSLSFKNDLSGFKNSYITVTDESSLK